MITYKYEDKRKIIKNKGVNTMNEFSALKLKKELSIDEQIDKHFEKLYEPLRWDLRWRCKDYLKRHKNNVNVIVDEFGNINCYDCEGCKDCEDCINCKDCEECENCSDCEGCRGCANCEFCTTLDYAEDATFEARERIIDYSE